MIVEDVINSVVYGELYSMSNRPNPLTSALRNLYHPDDELGQDRSPRSSVLHPSSAFQTEENLSFRLWLRSSSARLHFLPSVHNWTSIRRRQLPGSQETRNP